MRNQKYDSFDDFPYYQGRDLGQTYTPSATTIKVWSPMASSMKLLLYADGFQSEKMADYNMAQDEHGVWQKTIQGDLHGTYYTVQAYIDGKWQAEVAEPYAKAVGVNGNRAMIVDLKKTNPNGWESDKRISTESYSDIVLYEMHIRDFSIHSSSGAKYKGKYLGTAERGTINSESQATGIDHLVELGITHVHILPFFDFSAIDESTLELGRYNWGYDPQNYNTPEGSFTTNPFDGSIRIKELKTMIKALHDAGIGVVMDVVYNHTGKTEDSNFNQLVPGYYYRQDELGAFADASACGNETASERAMMRKFIIESVRYWAEEYHIDGFRFDLMGIHDIETMNEVTESLRAIDSSIFVYGEGWTAKPSPLHDSLRAIKANVHKMKHVAAFSDELRDAVKGHWYDTTDRGFVSGAADRIESIKFGIVGAIEHPQIDYTKVNYTSKAWASAPWQAINYVSCHDNHTLWDKLVLTNPMADESTLIRMHHLAQTIVFTSQGVPFLHNGAEFFRTKNGVENSYQSPDSVNQIDWGRKSKYYDAFSYYRDLIALRKSHPAFRMSSVDLVNRHLKFLNLNSPRLVGFEITGNANGDAWSEIVVIHNGSPSPSAVVLPQGEWTIVMEDHRIEENGLRHISDGHATTIQPISTLIAVKL